MSDERKGGIALIAGAAGGVFVMILHPTCHDLFAPEQFERVAGVASAVHALAIASMPVAFLGGLALSLSAWHRPIGSPWPRWLFTVSRSRRACRPPR